MEDGPRPDWATPMTTALCVTCPVLSPRLEPREPDWPMVCTPCRRRTSRNLLEIPDLYAVLPAALTPGSAGESTRVSGSREAPVPPSLDVVDLLLPARAGSVGVRYRLDGRARAGLRPGDPPTAVQWASHPDGDPDQLGGLSVLTTLDFWVRDWREARSLAEVGPDITVASMVGWLAGERLRWACDQHPAVDEFAADINRLAYAIRSALALNRYVERLSAACPRCDMKALSRSIDPRFDPDADRRRGRPKKDHADADDWIECGYCNTLWSEAEYARLATILIDEDRRVA